jgi:2-dehydro-3-deoxygluconokinase
MRHSMIVKRRVVSVGECMLEFSDRSAGNYRLGFAGDTFNTAWYCRALLGDEWAVDFVTALGDDVYSNKMITFFEDHGIGVKSIKRIPGRGPGLYLIHQADGERHFTYWRGQSAARSLADEPEFLSLALENAGVVYFSGITLAILPASGRTNLMTAIGRAREAGALVAFDPNERPPLWESIDIMRSVTETAGGLSDIVFPTFADERSYFGDASPEAVAERYRSWGAGEVVVKNGGEPALVTHGDKTFHIPAAQLVAVVDATAAGDSFNGAYLAARIRGANAAEAAQSAHKVAAIVVGNHGALVDMTLARQAM